MVILGPSAPRRPPSPATLAVLLLCLLGCALPSHAQEAVAQENAAKQEAAASAAAAAKETVPVPACDCTSQCEAMVAAKTSELQTSNHKVAELQLDLDKSRDELSSVRTELGQRDASLAEERRRAEELGKEATDLAQAAEQSAAAALADAREAHERTVAELEEKAQKYRVDLDASASRQAEAEENAASLRDSLDKLESRSKRDAEGLRKKVDSLSGSLDKVKDDLKTTNDKYYDTRREIIDLQAELRDAHRKLVSKYVNYTLLHEDVRWLAATLSVKSRKAARDGMQAVGDGWAATKEGYRWTVRTATPMIEELPVLLGDLSQYLRVVSDPHLRTLGDAYERNLGPRVRTAVRAVGEVYDDHVRPTVDGSVVPFVQTNLVPLWDWDSAKEAAETARLAVVSALRKTARAAVGALDIEEDGGKAESSSPVRAAAADAFGWIDGNAEQIVEVVAVCGCLFLFLYFCGAFVLRTVLFIVLLPFFPLRLLFGGKKKAAQGNNDNEGGAVHAPAKYQGRKNQQQNSTHLGRNSRKHKAQ